MTGQLTLAAQASLRPFARALAASLPISFRFQDGEERAAALMIDGRGSWAAGAFAEIEKGVERIMVIDPSDDDPDSIIRLAYLVEAAGAALVLSEAFAGNAAIAPLRARLGEQFDLFAFQAIAGGTIAASVLTHIRLARAMGITALTPSDVQSTDRSALLTARCTLGTRVVTLRSQTAVSGAMAPRHILRAYAPTALATLTLFDGDAARPALATVTRSEGEEKLPTIYETAHRTALRSLFSATEGSRALRDFATDVLLLRSMDPCCLIRGSGK